MKNQRLQTYFWAATALILLSACQSQTTEQPTDRLIETTVAQDAPVFTIAPAQTHQTLEGFGASGAWWSQYLGGWSDKNRNAVADLLFSDKKGIGLTQYRYNLGGGKDDTITDPWRTAETFMVRPGEYNWSRDKNARWFLQAAKKRGVKDFIAFANSAPRQLTKNGHTYGSNGQSNLAPENYAAFATYLADVSEHFRKREGITFNYVSPINEPQWDWSGGQEGTHFEADEVCAISKTVVDTFRVRRLKAEISAPEAGEYRSVYEAASGDDGFYADALFNGCVEDDVEHFAVHSYWSNDDQRKAAAAFMAANYPEEALHMTEWTEMQGGRDYGMDAALTLAETVHADLTLANVTSWQYWIAVSRYDYRDGLLYTDYVLPGDEESFAQTKKLWALGNFSRFIRPGAVRIGVSGAEDEGQQAQVPMVTPELERTKTSEGTRLFRLEDPTGDDNGPGTYSYPTNSVFTPGSFDFRSAEMVDAGDDVLFKLELGTAPYDPWNGAPAEYDLQVLDIYVDKGEAGGFTDLLPGRRAALAAGHDWDFAVFATGRTDLAESDVAEKVSPEMQEKLFVPDETQQTLDGNTLTIRVPKSEMGEPQPGWSYQFAVMGSEGNMAEDSLRVREVTHNPADWQFGGGSDGTSDPNVIDLFVDEGQTQEEVLAWQAPVGESVAVSAYLGARKNELVIVAINQGLEAQTVELRLPSDRTIKLTPYRTSAREDLQKLVTLKLRQAADVASGTVSLAPQSVTTYVAAYRQPR